MDIIVGEAAAAFASTTVSHFHTVQLQNPPVICVQQSPGNLEFKPRSAINTSLMPKRRISCLCETKESPLANF